MTIGKKIGLGSLALIALVLAGCTQQAAPAPTDTTGEMQPAANTDSGSQPAVNSDQPASAGITLHDGANTLDNIPADQIVDLSSSTDAVKTVTMTSSFGPDLGVMRPHFSIKEITVKKGDQVKINVTNTGGHHNFNLDEYNIHLDTPNNQQVTASFTADKTGTFIYYCAVPGHRGNGHWGVLNVVE